MTLYADLLQRLQTAPPGGSPYTRTRDGITYHYAKVPVGAVRIDRFLGKAGDADAEAAAEQMAIGMALARERRESVTMLRRAGLAGPDRTMGDTLDAIASAGLFADGAVLVGTSAYMLLEPFVGRRLPAPLLMTGDLDLATANVALSADPPEAMESILRRADPSYAAIPGLDAGKPPTRYRNSKGYLVDLLAPTRRRDERPIPLDALDAGAEPLQFLRWLIDDAVDAAALSGSGILVKIPAPARFAVHKLIVAQRRHGHDAVKRRKDLDQARALVAALRETDRHALDDALADARAQGPAWRDAIDRSMEAM